MSQKDRILYLLQSSPDKRVYCHQLMKEYLYHRAAARIHDLRRDGYDIRFVQQAKVQDSYYELIDLQIPKLAPVVIEQDGQGQLFFHAAN